jgi:hypothetical protein
VGAERVLGLDHTRPRSSQRTTDGYELHVLHLLGRNKQSLKYAVFFGDASTLVPLDSDKPPPTRPNQ